MNIDEEKNPSTDALKEGAPLSFTTRKPVMSTTGEKITTPPNDLRAVTGDQWAIDAREQAQIQSGVNISVRRPLVAEPQADRVVLYDLATGQALGEYWGVDGREILAATPNRYSLEPVKKSEAQK